MSLPVALELLAPARDVATAMTAIDCGADAVYIGAGHHGARAAATNSVDEIARLCEYAHRFGVRVYVTVNTLIYDDEFADVEKLVSELYAAGVDALIVQDLGLLRSALPPIALHASTQCDARTPEKARFLARSGMSCIVLPREMDIDEIRAVRRAVDAEVRLEGFVHGALCVSYSGDCRASLVNGGRSANRGECAQICRLPYDLTDAKGQVIVADKHLLSLRDMNRLAHLGQMADAGVTSFKIEGRLKSADYVANVVTAYSQALDRLCEASDGKYRRQAWGHIKNAPHPDVAKAFNRGFTSYFLTDQQTSAHQLGAHDTPKFVGQPVGKVLSAKPRRITARLTAELHNGDGLGYFDANGHFTGFRLNRVDGSTLHTASDVGVRPGDTLYRNADKVFDDNLASARPVRKISVDIVMTFDAGNQSIVAVATDERGVHVAVSAKIDELQTAQTPQTEVRRANMGRLGTTIYELRGFDDRVGEIYVPASVLAALRRDMVDALDASWHHVRQERRMEDKDAAVYKPSLDMHDNVANARARQFYTEHGAMVTEPALECDKARQADELTVMTTRYCLRRELGACLRTADGKKLPSPLFLRHVDGKIRRMRLDFDCANCRMNVVALKS